MERAKLEKGILKGEGIDNWRVLVTRKFATIDNNI